jgi:hypothetical protein
VTTLKIGERQTAALLALAGQDAPVSGEVLARLMTAAGRRATVAAAHETATRLAAFGLASKSRAWLRPGVRRVVRYQITAEGARVAALLMIRASAGR